MKVKCLIVVAYSPLLFLYTCDSMIASLFGTFSFAQASVCLSLCPSIPLAPVYHSQELFVKLIHTNCISSYHLSSSRSFFARHQHD